MFGTNILTFEEYKAVVEKRLDSSTFQIISIDEEQPNGRVGFTADHAYIKIGVIRDSDGGNAMEVLHFFSKALPANQTCRELMKEIRFFDKEIFFYEVLSPSFEQLLSGPKVFPRCYLTKPDVLIFEDMSQDGFRPVVSPKQSVDIWHSKQVLASLARFHSASIIKEESAKTSLKALYPEILSESFFVGEGKIGKSLDAALRAAQGLLPLLPKYKDDIQLLKRITGRFQGLKSTLLRFFEPDNETRNVVCHGDAWISNFLFKYDNETPIQAIILDFQMVRFGPPATDVQLYLHKSLDYGENRTQQMIDLQDFYYECLTKELQMASLDINFILPKNKFCESCKRNALMASIIVVLYGQICDAPTDFMAQLFSDSDLYDEYIYHRREQHVRHFFETDSHFRQAMNAALENLISVIFVQNN